MRKANLTSWTTRLSGMIRGITMSPWIAGVLVGLGVAVIWYAWNNVSRFSFAVLGVMAIMCAVLVLRYPIAGSAVVAFILTSNTGVFLPATLINPLMGLTLLCVFIRKLSSSNLAFRVTSLMIWIVLFFTWQWVTRLWAPTDNPLNPVYFMTYARNFLVVLLITWTIETPRQFRFIVMVSILGSIVSACLTIHSLYALLSSRTAMELAKGAKELRFGGTFRDPNMAALSLIPFLGLAIAFSRTRGQSLGRIVAAIGIVVMLIAIPLTLSRGAFLTTIALLFIMVWAERRRWLLLTGIAVAVSLIISIVPVDVIGRIASIGEGAHDASIGQRADVSLGGLRMAWDAFPWGVGLGNFGTFAMDYAITLDHNMVAHEAYVDVFAETGPIGLFLFIGMLVSALPRFRGIRAVSDNLRQNTLVAMRAIWVAILLIMAHNSYSPYILIYFVLALMSIHSTVFGDADAQSPPEREPVPSLNPAQHSV